MKLILKEYLASLRERGELDVILPDLLSQLGLNVFSRPGRGTRQNGVDVGAIGSIDGGPEKVYLFSIKPGDLSRKEWNSNEVQSLRPSLDEIIDAYIPSRLPVEHRDKQIVICIGIGGEIQEQVRDSLKGYIDKKTTDKISFEEWNGDKLASLIQSSFLREDLLPEHARSRLRKSLALLDEPETSHRHFTLLIKSIGQTRSVKASEKITAIRQIGICIWVLFAWARDAKNMEAAYLSSEIALLYGWEIAKNHVSKRGKSSREIESAFYSIFSAYQQICNEYLSVNVFPHVNKLHGISSAIHASSHLDINLKLFDLLGRLSIEGVWTYWWVSRASENEADLKQQMLGQYRLCADSIKSLLSNNPALFLPIKDEQSIDMSIALWVLALESDNHEDIKSWLRETVDRIYFSFLSRSHYPTILHSYGDLLLHPESDDNEYFNNVTIASVLYPLVSLWSALLNDSYVYNKIYSIKSEFLNHCNFQVWYPDDESEEDYYLNKEQHGSVLSHVRVDQSEEDYLTQVFKECDEAPYFNDLSAIRHGVWPLIFVASRHYRMPLPLQFMEAFRKKQESSSG